MMELRSDRPLSDAELALAVADAILNDRQNPGHDLPFQVHTLGLLARLGIDQHGEAGRRFLEANRASDLELRMAEYCWRLVGLGFLLPRMGGQSEIFRPTKRGREFLATLDATALTPGGLDGKLDAMGFGQNDLPRQYARLGQDCFLAGHYESSLVMLGVANEALILSLADALSTVQPRVMPTNRVRPAPASARQELGWVTDTLTTHRAQIRKALVSAGRDDAWVEPLKDLLSSTGQSIRLTRNDYGHPTGITATQDDALPLLTAFPRFAELCVRATAELAFIQSPAQPTPLLAP
jgi:hypothetical protein